MTGPPGPALSATPSSASSRGSPVVRTWLVPPAFLAAAAALAGCAKPRDAGADILEILRPLAGEWELVEFNRAGRRSEPEELRAGWATIRDDTLKLVEVRGRGSARPTYLDEFVLQVDPANPNGQMDFAYRLGKEAGQTRPGIYALDGDTLKLCLAEPGADRPTEFAGRADPPWLLVVLRRKPE